MKPGLMRWCPYPHSSTVLSLFLCLKSINFPLFLCFTSELSWPPINLSVSTVRELRDAQLKGRFLSQGRGVNSFFLTLQSSINLLLQYSGFCRDRRRGAFKMHPGMPANALFCILQWWKGFLGSKKGTKSNDYQKSEILPSKEQKQIRQ